jgi:hypothetical protein
METEYFINKLNEQKEKVEKSEIEVWLKTTYAFIEEYFGATSSRARSFQSIVHEYSTGKILGLTSTAIPTFKRQALEYIDEILIYLSESNKRKKEEPKSLSSQAPQVVTKKIMVTKTQLPFGISAEFFWGIIVVIVSASFILGQNFGSSKFDKEKNEYYEQVKSLQLDTASLHKVIIKKESIIKIKDSEIREKKDSLLEANQNMDKLYLLLGSYSKK